MKRHVKLYNLQDKYGSYINSIQWNWNALCQTTLWPPNKLKGEYKLNHMKMIRGKAFREGRAPSCEANAINATGRNSINNNGKEEWVDERRMVNLKGREPVMLGISSIS